MTNEQAKKMLKAKLECLKHETSGMYSDCNRCNCDECSLNYEQGNMGGEQKEALDMAIKALEQTTWIHRMNNDIYIKPMTPTRRAEIDEALKMRSMNFENVNKTVLCKHRLMLY